MDQRIGSGVPGSSGRAQWIGYGFLAGIVVGVLMGWMFAGFVGALFRVALFAMAVVPVVLLYIAWRRFIAPWLRPPAPRGELVPFESIETRAVVHSAVREPRAS
jgi:membrane protein implicated in regulation of membrane protease activity